MALRADEETGRPPLKKRIVFLWHRLKLWADGGGSMCWERTPVFDCEKALEGNSEAKNRMKGLDLLPKCGII